jgi:hypothetical protein
MFYNRLDDIPIEYTNYFTVCYMGQTRFFQVFESPESFAKYYKNIPVSMRYYYEVIRKDIRKLIIDIDEYVTVDEILDIRDILRNLIYQKKKCLTFPIIFDSSNERKSSYHIVVPDIDFSLEECKYIINILDPMSVYCDKSVYKSNQLFRIEGSTKYGEKRYKYILDTDSISEDLTRGLAFVNYGTVLLSKKESELYNISNYNINDQFKIRRQISPILISLTRISPGMCPICKRIHEHENAYLIYRRKQWKFCCFRSF